MEQSKIIDTLERCHPTDPAVWIEDFIFHIHMARGDDLHAIKYLPLKLKEPARHWLNSLP